MAKKKNPAAVALGRKGGKNSRVNLTPEARKALAQKAAAARWAGKKKPAAERDLSPKKRKQIAKAKAAGRPKLTDDDIWQESLDRVAALEQKFASLTKPEVAELKANEATTASMTAYLKQDVTNRKQAEADHQRRVDSALAAAKEKAIKPVVELAPIPSLPRRALKQKPAPETKD